MNKKGSSVIWITSWILVFSLVSIIYITVAILNFAIINDYILYNLQDMSEKLEADGVVKPGFGNITQEYGDSFTAFNFHWDDLWFLAYAIFFMVTMFAAYEAKPMNYFGFLTFLFYGIMFILFVLTIYAGLTEWFRDEILLKMIPAAVINLPKFTFYLENLGIFSAAHLIIALIINLVDFDFSKIKLRKRQEQDAIQDEEVV